MPRVLLLILACCCTAAHRLPAQMIGGATLVVPPEANWTPAAPASDDSVIVHEGPSLGNNAFAVIGNNALWQDSKDAAYTQKMAGNLSVSGEISGSDLPAQTLGLSPYSEGQKAAWEFQPLEAITLSGNVHNTTVEGTSSSETTGTAFSAQSHLPLQANLSLGLDRSRTDALGTAAVETDSYTAELHQPLGKLPLTAVMKGAYMETAATGKAVSRLPSLEQALVWKAGDSTTLQAGLRQQHYQDFPGITNQLNEALFVDWSEAVLPGVTWHSYAEMLNTRSTEDVTPYVASTGTNGSAQSTAPGGGPGLGSVVPVSMTNDTMTFSTGPSFNLQKDISASIEYSNRWDQAAVPGAVGSEQRVSVSLKGTF